MSAAQRNVGLAVVGPGRIGAGIALAFAYRGFQVKLVDLKPRPAPQSAAALRAAERRIAGDLAVLGHESVVSSEQISAIARRIDYVPGPQAADALADASFVFEAAPELLELKRALLSQIERMVAPEARIASSTSSFLVDSLAGQLTRPQRFLNVHWLNPAHLMPLVEVSPAQRTAPEVVQATLGLLGDAGKVAVRCAQSPGYIVPRVQALAMNEAARLFDEGVASAESIDIALRVGFGLRFAVLGVLEFIDWGGADTLLRASEYLRSELGAERFAAPESVAERARNPDAGGFRNLDDRDRRQALGRFVSLLRHLQMLPEPAP